MFSLVVLMMLVGAGLLEVSAEFKGLTGEQIDWFDLD
jgi:hypothetical protein